MSKISDRPERPDGAPDCYGWGMNGYNCDACNLQDNCMQEWRRLNCEWWKDRHGV
jgi:hypothetical protein